LESSKKQLLDELSRVVGELSAKIKSIEEKIQQNYSMLRKVTLTEVRQPNKTVHYFQEAPQAH
jgi:hypothetical protein